MWKGEMPFFPNLASAPFLTKNLTTSKFPSWHAKKKGVLPFLFTGAILTPCCNKISAYRVGGTEVSSKGKEIIKKLIKGEEISLEQSGLSKREWNELMEAFNIKEKLI